LADKTFSVALPEHNLVIEFVPGRNELPELSAVGEELERRIRRLMRLDKLLKTTEQQREAEKLAIYQLVGKRVCYIHHRGLRRKVGFFVNRFYYVLDRLRQALGKPNLDIFDDVVDRGLVARIILPADEETKADVGRAIIEFVSDRRGVAVIYERVGLETFVREEELTRKARERRISLAGTREPVVNAVIYDYEPGPQDRTKKR